MVSNPPPSARPDDASHLHLGTFGPRLTASTPAASRTRMFAPRSSRRLPMMVQEEPWSSPTTPAMFGMHTGSRIHDTTLIPVTTNDGQVHYVSAAHLRGTHSPLPTPSPSLFSPQHHHQPFTSSTSSSSTLFGGPLSPPSLSSQGYVQPHLLSPSHQPYSESHDYTTSVGHAHTRPPVVHGPLLGASLPSGNVALGQSLHHDHAQDSASMTPSALPPAMGHLAATPSNTYDDLLGASLPTGNVALGHSLHVSAHTSGDPFSLASLATAAPRFPTTAGPTLPPTMLAPQEEVGLLRASLPSGNVARGLPHHLPNSSWASPNLNVGPPDHTHLASAATTT